MNIVVDLNTPIYNGMDIVFRSPVDCSQVTGLIVYYIENGNTASKEFMFADAHGNNVGDIDHLFAENVAVKVILDVTTGMAFVQNADTNAYLEGRFAECSVGKATHEGGEIFNDYENNLAGNKGFRIKTLTAITTVNGVPGYDFVVDDKTLEDKAAAVYAVNDELQVEGYDSYYFRLKIIGLASSEEGSIITAERIGDATLTVKLDSDPEENYVYVVGKNFGKPITYNVGQHAEGQGTKATGRVAHAEGRDTQAVGNYSHTEGRGTIAGHSAHAEGFKSQALGSQSHAEGRETKAIGDRSHAEGSGTEARGFYSHAEGLKSKASGYVSHAEGEETQALGQDSHAEGRGTVASGPASHAEGIGVTASGANAHAEGGRYVRTVDGKQVITENIASGDNSHTEGRGTQALGNSSHAEGIGTVANGMSSHAEGHETIATHYSHAEGYNTKANGETSHAEGRNTVASGQFSHAEGLGTKAASQAQHVQGKYNIEDTANKYAHILGNGTADNPSNAHTIDWKGLGWFKGGLKVGGTGQDDASSVALLDANGKLPLDVIPDEVKAEIAQMVLALLANRN